MRKAFLLSSVAAAGLVVFTALFSSGCGPSCKGQTVLPSDWASLGFTPVEGGSVCTYDDKHARISHRGVDIPDLADKYSQHLKSSGWNVTDLDRKSLAIYADKGSEHFAVQFTECFQTIGTCTDAMIDRR